MHSAVLLLGVLVVGQRVLRGGVSERAEHERVASPSRTIRRGSDSRPLGVNDPSRFARGDASDLVHVVVEVARLIDVICGLIEEIGERALPRCEVALDYPGSVTSWRSRRRLTTALTQYSPGTERMRPVGVERVPGRRTVPANPSRARGASSTRSESLRGTTDGTTHSTESRRTDTGSIPSKPA
jgi:hypothetical protein